MPMTTVFHSLANAAGAVASAAASDAPTTTDFKKFERIFPLPFTASFRRPRGQTTGSRPPAETRTESYRRPRQLEMRMYAEILAGMLIFRTIGAVAERVFSMRDSEKTRGHVCLFSAGNASLLSRSWSVLRCRAQKRQAPGVLTARRRPEFSAGISCVQHRAPPVSSAGYSI